MDTIIGNIDNFSNKGIWGWCKSKNKNTPLTIQTIINNSFNNSGIADIQRADLKKAYPESEGKLGFNISFTTELSSDLEYEVKIYHKKEEKVILNSPVYLNNKVKKNKIFFLHIPKAAGTSLNEMLAKNFQKDEVFFHIEGDRNNKYSNIDTSKLKMFSGHVRLYEVVQNLCLANFLRITIVRDPFEQLISHFNWVKYISENPMGPFFLSHPKIIRDISLSLRKVDFSSLKSVEEFIKNMPDIGHRLFNNCQTRYLLNEIDSSKLDLNHGKKAIKSLSFFDVIGTLDEFDLFTKKISEKMEWSSPVEIIKTNALNNKYGLDTKSKELKEVLDSLLHVDQFVYDHIKELNKTN